MRNDLPSGLLLATLLGFANTSWSQTPAADSSSATPAASGSPASAADASRDASSGSPSRTNQLIENISHDEGGARIEERRYGGQTQSITVIPKGNMPAYDVQPGSGVRTWKILGF